MFNLKKELKDFDYREVEVDFKSLFPNLNISDVSNRFRHLKTDDPHETILAVIKDLWNGGYDYVLGNHGFWDAEYSKFSGHCHQCTPILGLVLSSLGFENVSYLECCRVYEHFIRTGNLEQVPPQEEPNPEMVEEFKKINRIPYCCLELFIEGKPYYISGKHVKPKDGKMLALLTPGCYDDFTGIMHHQDEKNKSGIYLKKVIPHNNPDSKNFYMQVVWNKQTFKDVGPEYFVTFLRMKLS
ncbi:MAG TPA: hypothetical protein VJG30_01265 [Candidatus Nanoarchaeia archaeon]|nr:hypothetical protein [Candidatus Nanoarchaeia archaeon]